MTREQVREHCNRLRGLANAAEDIADILDASFTICEGCGREHYNHFHQRTLKQRIEGAATSLRNIADTWQYRLTERDLGNES